LTRRFLLHNDDGYTFIGIADTNGTGAVKV